jgi:hypothetical protein
MGIETVLLLGDYPWNYGDSCCLEFGLITVWRAIFLLPGEPLGWRAGDTGTLSSPTNDALFLLLFETAQYPRDISQATTCS